LGLALIFLIKPELFSIIPFFIFIARVFLEVGYMFYIILIGSVCLYLLLYHPGWVLLAGVIAAGCYILRRYDLTPVDAVKDREADLTQEKLYTTDEDIEKKYEREAEKKMKPGYDKDPEWERVSKQLRKQVEEAEKKEEYEMHLEELTSRVA